MWDGSVRAAAAALMCLSLCGCGGRDGPETAPVSGVVTYQGTPVANADVTFQPANGPLAVGKTDAEGRFTLTTTNPGDGAVPGEHVALVTPGASAAGGDGAAITDESVYDVPNRNKQSAGLPRKYADPAKSDLRFTVETGKPNEFKLELTD